MSSSATTPQVTSTSATTSPELVSVQGSQPPNSVSEKPGRQREHSGLEESCPSGHCELSEHAEARQPLPCEARARTLT